MQHLGHGREQEREGNDVEIACEAARDRHDPVHERNEEERGLQMQGDVVGRSHERERGTVDERHERRIGRAREQRPLADMQVARLVEQPAFGTQNAQLSHSFVGWFQAASTSPTHAT